MTLENLLEGGEPDKDHLARLSPLEGRLVLNWVAMLGATWGHTVKINAITIRERVQLCRRITAELPPRPDLQESLEVIEQVANDILSKIFTPPLSSEEGVQTVPINEFLKARFRQMWNNEPYQSVELSLNLLLPDSATARFSPEWLRRALEILIGNAVEALQGQSQPWLKVWSRLNNAAIEIGLCDNGPGISNEVRSYLFSQPAPKAVEEKGQGLGLLLVRVIVETYGGSLRLASTGPDGTTMLITLPLEQL